MYCALAPLPRRCVRTRPCSSSMKRNTRSFVYATVASAALSVTWAAAEGTSTEITPHSVLGKVAAVRPGYIGLTLARESAARVVGVAPGGPAEMAGLRPGDLILQVDGEPVDARAVVALVSASAGKTLLFSVMRNGAQQVLHVRPLGAASASDDSAAAKALPSLDIAVQRSRFGPYADAASVGNFFVSRSPSGEVYPVSYSWEVPGLVLHEVYGTVGHHWRFEWDAQTEALNVINVNANRKIRSAKVQPDGTLLIGSALFAGEVKVRRGTGGEVVKDGGQGEFKATSVTPEEYRQVVEAELERVRLAKAADAARSEAFWNGVLGGITAAAQAYREVQAQRAAPTPMARNDPSRTETPNRIASVSREEQRDTAPRSISSNQPSGVEPQRRSGDSVAVAAAPTRSMRFILYQSMDPGAKAKHNPTCYSNVVTMAGPPGYGNPRDSNARASARAVVEGMYPSFIQKCLATADGINRVAPRRSPPAFDWNYDGDPAGPRTTYPTGEGDVRVLMP